MIPRLLLAVLAVFGGVLTTVARDAGPEACSLLEALNALLMSGATLAACTS